MNPSPKNKQKITREPVPLRTTGAVMSIINQALGVEAVRIALSSYVEGRGLPGDWRLEIQNARLVPVDPTGPPAEAN